MKFGIIGAGNHAYTRVMPAIMESGNSIEAVYSRDISKAERIGKEYSARGLSDLDHLVGEDIDAVYIASPNFLHHDHAKKAIEHGKHVLLEKPMVLKNEDGLNLIKMAETNHVKLAIGFHLRFHPMLNDIKQVIEKGKIGDIVYITGKWLYASSAYRDPEPDRSWWSDPGKAGGGAIMGTGVHIIDTVSSIMPELPEYISATRIPESKIIEDFEAIDMDYRKSVASIICSRIINNVDNSLHIYGNEGTIVGEGFFNTVVDARLIVNNNIVQTYQSDKYHMYRNEIDAFVKYVNNQPSGIARGVDGYNAVRIVNAAYESYITKTIIKF